MYVIDPLLIAVKFPFFLILYWLSAIAPKACIGLIFHSFFRFTVDVLVEGVKRLNKVDVSRALPDKNTVVVSNFTSPLDVFVIYLISKVRSLSSIAVVIPIDNYLYIQKPWEAALSCFGPIGHKYGTKLTSQNEIILRDKLVVVFAEGTSSNNKALLPLSPAVEPIFAVEGMLYQTMLLLWYPNTIPLPIPVVSPIKYLMRLFTSSYRPYAKVKITPHEKGSLRNSRMTFRDNGTTTVDLGLPDKKKFFEYYHSQTMR